MSGGYAPTQRRALIHRLTARANLPLWDRDRKFTPTQRRQLEKLSPHLDRETEKDRAFFARHPHRKHRVRFSADAEIAQFEIAANDVLQPPPGWRWFTLVRNEPEALRPIFIINRDDAETGLDVDEDLAEAIFLTEFEILLSETVQENGGAT
jgi:hypothetical protein